MYMYVCESLPYMYKFSRDVIYAVLRVTCYPEAKTIIMHMEHKSW